MTRSFKLCILSRCTFFSPPPPSTSTPSRRHRLARRPELDEPRSCRGLSHLTECRPPAACVSMLLQVPVAGSEASLLPRGGGGILVASGPPTTRRLANVEPPGKAPPPRPRSGTPTGRHDAKTGSTACKTSGLGARKRPAFGMAARAAEAEQIPPSPATRADKAGRRPAAFHGLGCCCNTNIMLCYATHARIQQAQVAAKSSELRWRATSDRCNRSGLDDECLTET